MKNVAASVLLSLVLASGTAAASQLGDLAMGMSEGQWAELATTGLGAAANDVADYSMFEYSFRLFWVRTGAPGTGKLMYAGSGHASGTWFLLEYDEATNAWSRVTQRSLLIHSYDQWTVNPANGWLYAVGLNDNGPAPFVRWDGSSWKTLSVWPGGYAVAMAIAYFPERNEIWAMNSAGGGEVYAYDIAGDTWTEKGGSYDVVYQLDMLYSPIHRKIVTGGGSQEGVNKDTLYVIDAAGAISAERHGPHDWGMGSSLETYDPGTGDFVFFYWADGSIHTYDPTANTWLDKGVSAMPFDVVSDPRGSVVGTVPDYGVVVLANREGVWLYKVAPGGTTVPDGGVPADGGGPDGSPAPDGGTVRPDGSPAPDGGTVPDGGTAPDGATSGPADGSAGGERAGPREVGGACDCRYAGMGAVPPGIIGPLVALVIAVVRVRRPDLRRRALLQLLL
jgi:hypothetical protein